MTNDDVSNVRRRRMLRLSGGGLLAGLAGCVGLGGGGGQRTTEPAMTETGMTETDGTVETTEAGMAETTTEGSMSRSFRVRIENVSTAETLQTMDGSKPVPLSPGAFVVHTDPGVLFETGEPASEGLERVAEDGSPGALAEELGGTEMAMARGVFDTPVDADSPGPIGPNAAYEFEVTASPNARLSFATMFIPSNDLFYAPAPSGIPLFEDGDPVSGDVTGEVLLWDAGTEVNQPPGEGADQAPRQSSTDTGEVEEATVRRVSEVDDGFEYPETADVIEVSLSPAG